MTSKSENAARRKGDEFGIHEKALQFFEYQTLTTTATDDDVADDDVARFEQMDNIAVENLLSVMFRRYGISKPLGRAILELSGIGGRA